MLKLDFQALQKTKYEKVHSKDQNFKRKELIASNVYQLLDTIFLL